MLSFVHQVGDADGDAAHNVIEHNAAGLATRLMGLVADVLLPGCQRMTRLGSASAVALPGRVGLSPIGR